MIAVICSEPLRHFLVTIEALESRCAGTELMATRALRGPAEGLMGLGERAGRNLSQNAMSRDQQRQDEKKEVPEPCRSEEIADAIPDRGLERVQSALRLGVADSNYRLGQQKVTRLSRQRPMKRFRVSSCEQTEWADRF